MDVYKKKEELLDILQRGFGLYGILDSARELLDNRLTLCTTNFRILASSPGRDVNDHFVEQGTGYFLSDQYVDYMQEANMMEQLIHNKAPFCVSFPDDPNIKHLFMGVHIQRGITGYLCVENTARDFCSEDYEFLSYLAKIISIEMQKNSFFRRRSHNMQEYLLEDLLEGSIEDEELAIHRLAVSGVKHGTMQVLLIGTQNREDHSVSKDYILGQLQEILPKMLYACYRGDYVFLLIGTDSERSNIMTRVSERLDQFLKLNQMNRAFSYPFERLSDMRQYYRQADFLLHDCRKYLRDSDVDYAHVFIEHLAEELNNPDMLKALVHPDIWKLLRQDKERHSELLVTLISFFRNHRNSTLAAKELQIHKSTFFYRIDKIRDFTELSIENSNLLFAYEFSIHLLFVLGILSEDTA